MEAQRFFIRLAYNGEHYVGWQIQPNGISVQEEIEKALSTLLRIQAKVVGCGRTDAGVHATEFFLHTDLPSNIDNEHLVYKLNQVLPFDIAVYDCFAVAEDAHARFSATARTYHYKMHVLKNPFLEGLSVALHFTPDLDRMNEAAKWLLTVTDFAAFCKAGGSQHTTICSLTECQWTAENNQLKFTVTADRFLRNMVRSMVGTMLDLGRGKIDLDKFKAIVSSGDRREAGTSAPAHGLYLARVKYPFL